MASLQDIRRRIKSVKSTQQITKAMKMVAAARLRRAQEAAVSNQPYAEKMYEVIADVASNAGSFSHPLLEVREGKTLYVVLASDKGLAGAYASNVFKETVSHIKDAKNTSIITVGRRGKEYFVPRKYDVLNSYMGFTERPEYQNARQIAVEILVKVTIKKYILYIQNLCQLFLLYLRQLNYYHLQHQSPPIINLLLNIFMNHQHNQCLDIYYRNILLQQYMHHYYNQQQVN